MESRAKHHSIEIHTDAFGPVLDRVVQLMSLAGGSLSQTVSSTFEMSGQLLGVFFNAYTRT